MEKDSEDLLSEALEYFDTDAEWYRSEYDRFTEDTNFSLGEQWDELAKAARKKEGRPCLVENRIDVSCIQTVNDIRQTRPAINVSPQDDGADIEKARVLKGIIKNIEKQSNADNAYDTAVENSVRGGYGYIRVGLEYANEKSFDQEARIYRVENPLSCMLGPHEKLDGSDAKRGWVFVDMPLDEFEDEYPDEDPKGWDTNFKGADGWFSDKHVRVAEFYYKECEEYTLALTEQGAMDKAEAEKLGLTILDERKSERETVRWCKLTCNSILEKTDWIGKYIPIVPVYGKVVFKDGRRKSYSLTHQGRDPQIRYNYHITAETEFTALQPKSPWVAYEDQFTEAQYRRFAESNVKNHAVLTTKLAYDKNNNLLPLPQRQQPPSGSPALMQQAMVAADGIKATLGIYDASLGARGNETSGRAILARQQEGDNATFHFVDNLATAIRHVGRILVDIIPKIYSTRTTARILGDDGEAKLVPINQPVRLDGKEFIQDPASPYMIEFDAGEYDVSVEIGPSYASKRQEQVAFMQEMYRAFPQAIPYTADIFFRNQDWEGAQELAERAKKLLPPEVREETQENRMLMAAQQQIEAMGQQLMQMDAQLKQKQENEQFKNELEARKIDLQHQIDQQKIELDKEKLALETLKAQGEITPQQMTAMLAAVMEIDGNMRDMAQAVDFLMTEAEQGLEGQDMTSPENEVEIEQGLM